MGGPFGDLKTRLVNKIGQPIGFEVDGGSCPLRGLPPGKSRSVSLSRMIKLCKERGSAEWPIRVLINGRFHGMCLHPSHILKMTRIVFRYKFRDDGSSVPIAEGIGETFFNRVFGCCISWGKRTYVEIAEADSTRRRLITRRSQRPNIIAPPVINGNNLPLSRVRDPETKPLENRLQLRQESWRKKFILAFPSRNIRFRLLWNGGGVVAGGKRSCENSNLSAESRKKKLHRLFSIRRRDKCNRSILLVLAFLLVGSVHLLYN
ncbi:uncharacterized protein LOC121784501 isoform X1 [Salvia splendens]|uniref:uncharacterized protein LOC121784501 isoform X1 n=1 Tax=Salvia splendens TaxID=180675 RepID=UPI001C26DEEA|nr:uncharacterized protein LOC121784501 isoform X1 [Salvia splendens]